MIIDEVSLHNFKSFEGTCKLDGLGDSLSDDKRIILIGGLNGAGKTTLFEAILLCLYGRLNKTLWPSKGTKREDYHNYIIAVTNNNAKSDTIRTDMWIKLVLKDVELGGFDRTLSVTRLWTIDNNSQSLHQDGQLTIVDEEEQPIEFVSEENWQQFILDVIPYEVSQFFFFDGEKIQDFVKDEDKEFAESLEKVLGISLYDQLKDDLEEVRRRILREYNRDEDIKVELTKIDHEIAELEREILKREEVQERLAMDMRAIEESIENIDAETRRITQMQADTLQDYSAEKEKLLEEKGALEEKIFSSIQDEIPFLIMASLCIALQGQIDQEIVLEEFVASQKSLEPKIHSISTRLFEGEQPIPSILDHQKEFYRRKLMNILQTVLTEKPPHFDDFSIFQRLSKNDIEDIRLKIHGMTSRVSSMSSSLDQLQEIEPRLKKISKAESKSTDPEARRLYEKRGKLAQELEQKQRLKENLSVDILKQGDEVSSKRRQRTELEKKVEKTLARKDQMNYTKRLREVLDEFSHRLRARKVSQLQDYTLQMWNKLAHKKDQVKSISINPDRQFSIELFDARNRLIDKTKLSAGEKELLAISLIWALSKLANRNLPVVIDTPLGRLDSVHRENIARNYFSNASHQVILLSTNTEIIRREYEAIQPFLCKQFLIRKDSALKTSTITEGYF